MAAEVNRDRRRFLTGRFDRRARAALHHVSSAVVSAFPERCADVARRIAELPETEVHHIENGKIIVVLEGRNSGVIGTRLTEIALMDGVLSANLVFEQIDEAEPSPHERSGGEP